MISKLSNRITQNLLKRHIILEEDQELYTYGLFMIISHMTFFIIAVLFGIILNITLWSILFFVSFCLVRNYAGGIHANSEFKCSIITTLSILFSEVIIKVFIDYELKWWAFAMLIISSICLIAIKPVATSQKEISIQEKTRFHKNVIILTVLILVISVICMILDIYGVTICLSIGLTLASILLILGRLQLGKK